MEIVVGVPGKGRGAIAARDLASHEVFHRERPLLCVATDVKDEDLLCRQCLAPLGEPADHVQVVAPDILESEELRSALENEGAERLCAPIGGSCTRCGARFCADCVAWSAQATHTCAAMSALREGWPKLVASPRFRLFVQGLGLVSHNEPRNVSVVAAIDTLCQPVLPGDENAKASATMDSELAEPLALLHCATVQERLAWAHECGEAPVDTSAAVARITQWCTVTGYRKFERRIATNAHGLRCASPAGSVLAAAIAACPTLSAAANETVLWAVAGVGLECELPFYCATAIFAQASALNHSCVPSVEVVSSERAELQLRTTRSVVTGDELSLAYISRTQRAHCGMANDSSATGIRAELLERYGFVCRCALCASVSWFDLLSQSEIERLIIPHLDQMSVSNFVSTCKRYHQLASGAP